MPVSYYGAQGSVWHSE